MESTQLFEMAPGLSGGWKAVRSEFSVVQFSDSPGSAIRRELIRRAGRMSRGKALFYQKDAKGLAAGLRCRIAFFAGRGGVFHRVVSSSQNGIFFAVLAPAVFADSAL